MEEVRSSILLSSTGNPRSQAWGFVVFEARPNKWATGRRFVRSTAVQSAKVGANVVG
jgi:hypothetical protein